VPSFRDVTGHKRLTSLLSSAIARGTLPPSLLFQGPAGIGKFLTAQAVAASMNCLEFKGLKVQEFKGSQVQGFEGSRVQEFPADACGACRSCDRIERGVHVDVLTLEPDERASIKIDVVRDALDRTGFRPFEGKRRVVIIRDADALEVQAQNALLKALEEPPPGTVFILTTSMPGALLPTVRSRCMQMRFARLTEGEVAAVLERRFEFSKEKAREAAAFADGSVAQALALGSTDLAVLRETAFALLQHVTGRAPMSARLQAASTVVGQGRSERTRGEVALILQILASLIRDIELLNTGIGETTLANPSLAEDLDHLRRAFHGDRARAAFAIVDRAIAAVHRNAGTKIVTDWVAVQI
jgi:DNA polymerase-3 subunit delta'